MKPHLAIVMITAALAGCAVCAEPYDVGPYGMTESEGAPPARAEPPVSAPPRFIEKAPEAPPSPARKSKSQSQ